MEEAPGGQFRAPFSSSFGFLGLISRDGNLRSIEETHLYWLNFSTRLRTLAISRGSAKPLRRRI